MVAPTRSMSNQVRRVLGRFDPAYRVAPLVEDTNIFVNQRLFENRQRVSGATSDYRNLCWHQTFKMKKPSIVIGYSIAALYLTDLFF